MDFTRTSYSNSKKVPNGWGKDENGKKMHWVLDNHNDEGIIKQNWFI